MQLREVHSTLTIAFLVLAMHIAPNQTRVLLDALHSLWANKIPRAHVYIRHAALIVQRL